MRAMEFARRALSQENRDALAAIQIPGPTRITEWSVEFYPTSIKIKRAAIALLDARVVASVTFDDLRGGLKVNGAMLEVQASAQIRYHSTTP